MQIREATLDDKEKWNAFVDKEGGSFFHYYEWKPIYEVNNWFYIPLILETKTKEIIGILPLVKIKRFMYSKLVSLPDGASGGFVLKKNLIPTEKANAVKMFMDYIDQNYSKGCSTFLLKENLSIEDASRNEPTPLLIENGFTFRFDNEIRLPCTFRLRLTSSFENDIWYGRWRKNLRNQIRKSRKQGVHVKEETQVHPRDDLITMLISTYKQFGSTPLLKEEIALRFTTFKDKTKVWVASVNNKPIGFLLCYYHMSSFCYASKMGLDSQAHEYITTIVLMSEAIRDACENGYQFFEFGVTESIELARWKEKFKAIKIPMRIYEKKYSTVRTFFEKMQGLIKWSLRNPHYILDNRRRLLRKFIREKIQHL